MSSVDTHEVEPEVAKKSIAQTRKEEKKKQNEELERLKKEAEGLPPVSLLGIVRKSAPSEMWRVYVGGVAAAINGSVLPAFSVILGETFNVFTKEPDEIRQEVPLWALLFIGLGVVMFIFTFLSSWQYGLLGEAVTRNARINYFQALCRRRIEYFDNNDSGSLASRLGDVSLIQAGVGEKISPLITSMSTMILALGIAFYYSWLLSIIMLATTPLLVFVGALQMKFLAQFSSQSQESYAAAGQVATEVLSSIRTVKSFGRVQYFVSRYTKLVWDAYNIGRSKSIVTGAGMAVANGFIFVVYAIGMYAGGRLVADGDIQPGDVLTVFFSIVIGATQLGQMGGVVPDIIKAKAMAAIVFHTIDETNNLEHWGTNKIETFRGSIQFKDGEFAYPTRPDVIVMRNFDLKVEPGQRVALVGSSGGGKSTVVQLLQGFYKLAAGELLLDGVDAYSLDLSWLRQHIGVVSQEPVLFNGTIRDNLLVGNPDATDEQLEQACMQANAWTFVSGMPDKLATRVGEGGAQLSGGQKQRIAIARALLKNPSILLLDEATSALDSESEKVVQDALDKAQVGRTSIVIAHRLSTIRDADIICVVVGGTIIERGSHDQLMELGGEYAHLVQRQVEHPPTNAGKSSDDAPTEEDAAEQL